VISLAADPSEAEADLEIPERWSSLPQPEVVSPALLDGAFQAVGAWLAASAHALVPAAMDRVAFAPGRRVTAARLRLLRADASGAVVDVELRDADGAVALAVQGLLLRRLAALPVPPARLDLAQGLGALVWSPDSARREAKAFPIDRPGVWWILDSGSALAEQIAARLRAAGERVRIALPAEATRRVAADRFEIDVRDARAWDLVREGEAPRGVLHLWSLEPRNAASDPPSPPERARWLCEGMLGLLRALLDRDGAAAPQLWIAAAGAETALVGEKALAAASLFALARVLEFEHPELQCTTIDLASADSEHACDALWTELCAPGRGSRVAYRAGARLLPRLEPVKLAPGAPARIDPSGAYLITGGAGALGTQLAEWLVQQGACDITLVSRHAPEETRAQRLAQLAERCPGLRHCCADVSERESIGQVLAGIRASGRALRGVFHLAGVLDEAPLVAIDAARLDGMLAAKLRGAWHLHELTADDPLACFVSFSSVSALVGLPGQGGYAAANAFLDALAQQRRASGLPALSIDWGVWEGEGMASTAAQERLARRGFKTLSADAALRALATVLAANPVQIAVLAADEEALRALGARSWASSSGQRGGWREELRALPAAARLDHCARLVRGVLRDVLGLAGADQAATDAPLVDLGLDSLRAVELRNELSRCTGLRLPASFAFDCATLAGAARSLVERLGVAQSPPAPCDAKSGAPDLAALPASELLSLVDRALQDSSASGREGRHE
jgi:NADP-dependent 3-hydroxy acid dehydrogenase YdfG/acyl carrier protein